MKIKGIERLTCYILIAALVFSGMGLGSVKVYATDERPSATESETPDGGNGKSVVEYVKEKYLQGIKPTEIKDGKYEYVIPIKTAGYELGYSELPNTELKEILDFIYNDLYSDYALCNTKFFLNPFRYYVQKMALNIGGKTDQYVKEILFECDASLTLNGDVVNNNLEAMRKCYDAIMRDVKSFSGLTTEQKVLLVHDSMARELIADYDNRHQDDGEGTTHWGTLKNGKGSSAGYAYLFKACMNDLGIKCDVVYNSNKPNYWNMVEINDNWYHVDVWLDDIVTSKDSFENLYDNIVKNETMYGDSDDDNNNEGYVSHKFYLKTDNQMKEAGYSLWGRIKKMGDISSDLENLEKSAESELTGLFSDKVGNMAFLKGNWYIADPVNISKQIVKTNYSGSIKSAIATDYPVMYVQSDGKYIYYASSDKIVRIDEEGQSGRTGYEAPKGKKITEFAIKQGQLVFTVRDDTDFEHKVLSTSDVTWILEGCQHKWEDNVTPPTCVEKGYTTKVCSICDYSFIDETSYIEPTGHSGGTATCITKAVCNVCNKEYGQPDPDNHVGDEEIKDSKPSTCSDKGYSGDKYCSACGELWEKGIELDLDPDNHTGNTEIRDAREPSCIAIGYTGDEYCTDCNTKLASGTNIQKIAHKGGRATCVSPAICEVCGGTYGLKDEDNHVHTEIRDAAVATCTSDGYTGDKYCLDCNKTYEKGQEIKALGHNHRATVIEPTCTDQGYTRYDCSRCSDTYIDPQSYVPAAGHKGGAASCIHKAVCSVCGQEYGETASNNHINTELQNFLEASCLDGGYSGDIYCKDCKQTIETGQAIPALGHLFEDKVVPPTCTVDGYTKHSCTRCKNSAYDYKDSVVAATGHRGGTATCASPAKCEVCGQKYGTADPNKHQYSQIVYEGTCVKNGFIEYTCEFCGNMYIVETGGKGDHKGGQASCSAKAVCEVCHQEYGDFDSSVHVNKELKDVVDPTCFATGYSGDEYCKDCGAKIAEGHEVAKAPHDYTKVTTASTCTEKGYTTYTCKRCKGTKVENYTAALGHNFVTTIKPASSSDKGQGTVVVECSRCHMIKSSTKIDYAQAVTLLTTDYTYNGSKKKPAVSVTDSKGQLIPSSNYDVAYSSNLNVGQAKVVVTMKGKYSGTFTRYFIIKPKPTSIKSMSGLTKGIRINWKKQTTQVTGYEIYYSTSSKFSSASTKKLTLTKGFDTKKVTGLTKNKKYYVRIRTYTKVKIQGVTSKVYSKWSSTKNAKSK